MLEQIEVDYERFMQADFIEWVNLMMTTQVFQSYSNVVTPYEVQPHKMSKITNTSEELNYVYL